MTRIKSILDAMAAGRSADALAATDALLGAHPDCPYLLVWRAVLIQVQDPAGKQTLEDAEASLLRAHASDPNYLPALQELAHFYHAVSRDHKKARIFASRYIEKSQELLQEMRAIINGDE